MKQVPILIVLLCTACATHAPMSEMVMFEKATIPDSANYIRSGVVTYFQPGIITKDFEENREGDFISYSDLEFPSITIHTFILRKDGTSRSLSLGRGLGIDWTKNLRDNYYGTFAISAPHSFKTSIQRVIVNRRWIGFSGGVFTGLDTKRYISVCGDNDVCSFWPDRSAFLFNSGIRSRFLIRDPHSPGLTLTGSFEAGYIWNTASPFIGFNISLTSLE